MRDEGGRMSKAEGESLVSDSSFSLPPSSFLNQRHVPSVTGTARRRTSLGDKRQFRIGPQNILNDLFIFFGLDAARGVDGPPAWLEACDGHSEQNALLL